MHLAVSGKQPEQQLQTERTGHVKLGKLGKTTATGQAALAPFIRAAQTAHAAAAADLVREDGKSPPIDAENKIASHSCASGPEQPVEGSSKCHEPDDHRQRSCEDVANVTGTSRQGPATPRALWQCTETTMHR